EALALVKGLKTELANIKEVDIVIAPPFTALSDVSKAVLDSNIRLGAQNMSEQNYGAFTGEIAAGMLKEFSVRYVIRPSRTSPIPEGIRRIDRPEGGRRPRRLPQADCLRRRNPRRTRSGPNRESPPNSGARQPRRSHPRPDA